MNKPIYSLISMLSFLIGGASLFAFGAFAVFGPLNLIDLNLGHAEIILINTTLSLSFFFLHSVMIRDSIRDKITKTIPQELFPATYSIASGIVLFVVIILWQESKAILYSLTGPYIYLSRILQFASVLGFLWAAKTLSGFDPFGNKKISAFFNDKKEEAGTIVYSGPYGYVRHPFYFLTLVMIWAYPTTTLDRLLFNCIWTIWIVVGTLLEEKDLTKNIGNEYLEYKKKVPMLVPYKIFGHKQ